MLPVPQLCNRRPVSGGAANWLLGAYPLWVEVVFCAAQQEWVSGKQAQDQRLRCVTA